MSGTVDTTGFVSALEDNDQIPSPTTFDNGVTITLDAPSADNFVVGNVLRLSVDNTGDAATPANPLTESIELAFDTRVTAFGFEFGEFVENDVDSGVGRAPGNDSGTTLTAGSYSFDFSDVANYPAGVSFNSETGYAGFFGVVADPGDSFRSVLFKSNGFGNDTDDDFTVQSIALAPVPLPAGLPLLAVGLGAFGLLRRRAKA